MSTKHNVLIGFNGGIPDASKEQFEAILRKSMQGALGQFYSVDSVDALFKVLASTNDIDCVILNQIIGTEKVGLNLWRRILEKYPYINLIPVIDSNKRSTNFCKNLYQTGISNAVFQNDFKGVYLSELIIKPRESMAAYTYYELNKLSDWRGASADDSPTTEPVTVSESFSDKSDAADKPSVKTTTVRKDKPTKKPVNKEEFDDEPWEYDIWDNKKDTPIKEPKPTPPPAVTKPAVDMVSIPVQKPAVPDSSNKPTKKKEAFLEGDAIKKSVTVSSEASDALVSAHNLSFLEDAEGYVESLSYLTDISYEPDIREYKTDPEVDTLLSAVVDNFSKKGIATLQLYESGKLSKEDLLDNVEDYIKETFGVSKEMCARVSSAYADYLWRYGKIAVLLDDADVSDIRLLGPEVVLVQVKGKWYKTNITFSSAGVFRDFVVRLCTQNNIGLNNQNAQPIFTDIVTHPSYRLRFQVSGAFINSSRLPSAHIRKISKVKLLVKDLVDKGLWSYKQAAYLIRKIRSGEPMIVCGSSGSGKTHVLNCLIEYLDPYICGICMQEAEELFSDTKKNIEFQHSVYLKGEGKNNYSLRDLATMGLLKNALLFIIGEIKGNEARDFFTAYNTGGQCICTTHANGIKDALPRIADLAKYAGDYSQADILEMISRAGGCIVYMRDFKVIDIANILGWDRERQQVKYEFIQF